MGKSGTDYEVICQYKTSLDLPEGHCLGEIVSFFSIGDALFLVFTDGELWVNRNNSHHSPMLFWEKLEGI